MPLSAVLQVPPTTATSRFTRFPDSQLLRNCRNSPQPARVISQEKLRSKCGQTGKKKPAKPCVSRLCGQIALTPTRCRNLYLKQFCLDIICSYPSDCFDYPYYLSYTMDAYQNLISSDKLRRAVRESRFGWLSTRTHIL